MLWSALFLGVLLFASLEDVRGMHVRNAYPAILLGLSIIRVVALRPPFPLAVLSPLLMFCVLYVFWHFGGIGGADVKILSAMAIGNVMGVWVVLLVACAVFILYSLVSGKTRQALPFVPAILVGALVEIIFSLGGRLG